MRDDWVECSLGDVCENVLKVKRKEKILTDFLLYLDIGGIDNQTNQIISHKVFTWETAPSRAQQIVKQGDILFSTVRTYLKNIAQVRKPEYNNEICSSGFTVIRGIDKTLNSNYMFYMSIYDGFLNPLNELQTGTSYPAVRDKDVFAQGLKLAPLPEQRAIVAKIEQLFSSLDSGIADLEKAQAQLKIYRQAALKKAFEGELSKEWRAQQTNLPTAEELLEQIKEERQNYYIKQLENWNQAVKEWDINGKVGKKPSKTTKPKNIPNVEICDIENYDKLPSNWIWSRFGNVTYKIGDIDHKMPKSKDNGLPYLSTGNLKKNGTIDFESAKTISKKDFDRLALKMKPEKGDIVFPRYGTIGRNILINFNRDFLVSYSCAIIKNITSLMDEKFSYYYSLSPVTQKEIKRYTVETTQKNIGIASIEKFVFPLCSKEEQKQIVQEIEFRLSVCDKVEQTIKESLEKAKALRQSILKKAFEGRLLSESELAACKQEKDYQPASELLKKIQAEKAEKDAQMKLKKNPIKKQTRKKACLMN